MNTAKERLLKILDEISDQEVDKILDFAEFIKAKKDNNLAKELAKASESSLDFWDNEVWQNNIQIGTP